MAHFKILVIFHVFIIIFFALFHFPSQWFLLHFFLQVEKSTHKSHSHPFISVVKDIILVQTSSSSNLGSTNSLDVSTAARLSSLVHPLHCPPEKANSNNMASLCSPASPYPFTSNSNFLLFLRSSNTQLLNVSVVCNLSFSPQHLWTFWNILCLGCLSLHLVPLHPSKLCASHWLLKPPPATQVPVPSPDFIILNNRLGEPWTSQGPFSVKVFILLKTQYVLSSHFSNLAEDLRDKTPSNVNSPHRFTPVKRKVSCHGRSQHKSMFYF